MYHTRDSKTGYRVGNFLFQVQGLVQAPTRLVHFWGGFGVGLFWGGIFFPYSTIVCLSALRNLSLHLSLRIHQLVLVHFSPVIPFETSVQKKKKKRERERKEKEEEKKKPIFLNKMDYFSSYHSDSLANSALILSSLVRNSISAVFPCSQFTHEVAPELKLLEMPFFWPPAKL